MFVDFKLDDAYQGPIYKQIAERISDAIQEGKLAAGFKLPTVRELSGEIGVACGTIKHAYEYLEEQGFVEMVQGSGSFVVYAERNGNLFEPEAERLGGEVRCCKGRPSGL